MNFLRKIWKQPPDSGQADSKTSIDQIPSLSNWVLDEYHSTVKFGVTHMKISQVWGKIPILKSNVQGTSPHFWDLAVEVTFDMQGLQTDMSARDAFLKSAETFDVEKFPTASFRSTRVFWQPIGTFEMEGNLTIKDITKPVMLQGKIQEGIIKDTFGAPRVVFVLKGNLNRKDWGIIWNKVIEGSGVVSDLVQIEVHAELTTPEGIKALKESKKTS